MLAVVAPVAIFVFTQLDFVQEARGWFVHGLIWDIGRKEIVADLFAPIWIVSIIVVAAIERRMLDHYAGAVQPPETTSIPIITEARARAATWAATAGAIVVLVMSWTREWGRFDERPDAFWYVLAIVAVFLLLAVPVWWVRYPLFRDIHDTIAGSRTAQRIGKYLFIPDDKGGPRWLVLFSFAALTAFIAITVLDQFDALLKGMHPNGGSSVGMNGLASVFELDLSQKPAQIAERVAGWALYADEVGPGFATGYSVAGAYLLLETLILIPAYTVCIGILLLHARRTPPDDLSAPSRQSYALVNGVGFLALAILVISDLVENLMTWIVIDSAWSPLDSLSSWTVRLMWFASLFRTVAVVLLVAVAVLSLAFRSSRYRWVGDALVAVRGQILVLIFVAALLGMAQMEDVIRRWTVSVAILTVVMAMAVASFVQWTSAGALARLRHEKATIDEGGIVAPAVVTLPWSREAVPLRSVVVAAVFGFASAQVLIVGAVGFPAGLGFVVAAGLIAIVWVLGIPLPPAAFRRGDRSIDPSIERWLPRMLGAVVYVTLGIVVVRAATSQLVFARHVDAWMLFGLVPLAVGLYRIHTKTWDTMGALEASVVGAVGAFGVMWWVIDRDPELSAVALAFVGLLITYGSMAFYYSYAAASLPSRLSREGLSFLRVEPLIIAGATIAVVTGFAIIAAPLVIPARIGTVAVVLLGAMLFAGLSAAAVAYAETTRPPKIVAAFRLRRMPVFIFMGLWVSLAGLAATGASNDVALIDRSPEAADAVVVSDAWERWLARNAHDAEPGEAIPMVFIAASGGGIRAAAWSSYVMDCLFTGAIDIESCTPARDGGDPVVAASSVSGGSLGLAAWGSSVTHPQSVAGVDDWVKARLGDDYLAGAMAWLLLVDTPRSFIGFGPAIRDRAEIMELTWERSWVGVGGSLLSEGMFDVWGRHDEVPLLVFNGTSVTDPCRFNASTLSATAHGPSETCTSLSPFENRTAGIDEDAALAATKDLAAFLCPDQDVKFSTAALMSARFPVITPSARIGGGLADCGDGRAAAYVVDGGYLEGSGAGTITELWQDLEPRVAAFNDASDACIVPFLVQIDNGYENPRSAPVGTTPIELLVPVRTLLSSQFGRIANAREQAAIEFDRPFEVAGAGVVVRDADGVRIASRYARIVTRAHPGVQAPLGWTLSATSFDDLRAQLTIEENVAELDEVQRWLAGGLTCEHPG